MITVTSYWRHVLLSSSLFVVIFVTIAILYYVLFFPFLLTWYIMSMGPVGLFVAHIQWILQSGSMTKTVCQNMLLKRLNDQIFDMALYNNGQKKFLYESKFIKSKPKRKKRLPWRYREFWTYDIPLMTYTLTRGLAITLILAIISLIPIIGPLITNQLLSPRRAYSYLGRYFFLTGEEPTVSKTFQYEHIGRFICFGMTSGILEFLPFSSIITMTSNTIGAAKWASAIIEENKPVHAVQQ
ncbi:hypothetical protein Kpol_233p3 [Vanderwaltozyma polyspora DSM 70294]|uniref:Outer spore wall protein RRT8 n=1 Tax=Vanderwaltozyma polyspora (strain ATCC 22028 / DSM 70294 / BCRC 21397 / CBS 2163 / NBRC 10782 / NRRL Y-8283 / UCD 57-17) TaxID=436907 RepID=A7TTH9_VANPO|nr:uncharacterized protein Kpol_233p3 [Vanderwaltozyma polyspora DSM 70294]EDO14429.1 hypothetical protein Kpol_233p3 [Vanderwaltozyma polyspora DSM 70294]